MYLKQGELTCIISTSLVLSPCWPKSGECMYERILCPGRPANLFIYPEATDKLSDLAAECILFSTALTLPSIDSFLAIF